MGLVRIEKIFIHIHRSWNFLYMAINLKILFVTNNSLINHIDTILFQYL